MNPKTTIENATADATRELHLAAHNSVRSLTDSAHHAQRAGPPRRQRGA